MNSDDVERGQCGNPDQDRVIRLSEERLRILHPSKHDEFVRLNPEEKMNYIETHRELFAMPADQSLLNEVNGILHPLLRTTTLNPETMKLIFEVILPSLDRKTSALAEYHYAMTRVLSCCPERDPRMIAWLSLPSYLMLFEGGYTWEIDFIVFLVILNGTEYYRVRNGNRKRHVVHDFDKISGEWISDRLAFLRDNGFSVVADASDRILRNAVAHLDIVVKPDGSLSYFVRGQGQIVLTAAEFDERFAQLLRMTDTLYKSIMQFIKDG